MKQINFSAFEIPGPRSKFQAGDIVVIYIPERGQKYSSTDYFRVYHPKYALPYIGKIGEVVSVKRMQMSAKYAIKFDDGAIIPIDTGFLLGPFGSIEKAKKYAGKNGNVKPDNNDLKGYVERQVQSNVAIENEIKNLLCNENVGFKWLDEPITLERNNYNIQILAVKKNRSEIKHDAEDAELNFANQSADWWDKIHKEKDVYPELNDCFLVFKCINPLTKELHKTSTLVKSRRVLASASSYFIQVPELYIGPHLYPDDAFRDGKLVDSSKAFCFSTLPVTSTKSIKRVIEQFRRFEFGIKSGLEFFMAAYGVTEDSTVIKSNTVFLKEEMLGSDMSIIPKFIVEGSCFVTFKGSSQKIKFLPKKVGGWLTISTESKTAINNLEGLDKCELTDYHPTIVFECPVENLEHFPQSLNKSNVTFQFTGTLDGLKGIPSTLHASVHFMNLKSFRGAEDCNALGNVRISEAPKDLTGFFNTAPNLFSNIPEEDIERHRNYKDIYKRLPELDKLF